MATAGPNTPSTAANQSNLAEAVPWVNPNNGKVEDGSLATLAHVVGAGQSYALAFSGFAWPAGIASVSNILVEVKCQNATAVATQWQFSLNDGFTASQFATPDTTLAWRTAYDGALTDVPGDLNYIASNTDVIRFSFLSGAATDTYSIDSARVTITYTVASAGGHVYAQTRRTAVFRATRR